MEGDDAEATTGTQDRERGTERTAQIRELVVHRDAQRLEDAGRRVRRRRAPTLDAGDESPELVGSREPGRGATPNDRGRKARGLRLLPVLEKDPSQLVLRPVVHDVRGRHALVRVGAHIQWA